VEAATPPPLSYTIMNSDLVIAVPLLSLLGVATWIDLVDRRIPNGLSFGGAILGVATHAYLFGTFGVGVAALGWGLCLVCFLPLYRSGGMAAGDVKLMAMAGAFLGPVYGFIACLFTLVAGAIVASMCLGWARLVRGVSGLRWAGAPDSMNRLSAVNAIEKIPYAVAILLGTIATLLQPEWLTSVLPLEVLQ
jgi:prepilin peptidase CpaA